MQEKSELVFINGNLTAFQCIEQLTNPEIISLFVRKPNHVLMQDSVRPHMAQLTASHLANLGIPVLSWPAKSDMNPIENLWVSLRGVSETAQIRQLHSSSPEDWEAIPREVWKHPIVSLRRRYLAVIHANGGHTRY